MYYRFLSSRLLVVHIYIDVYRWRKNKLRYFDHTCRSGILYTVLCITFMSRARVCRLSAYVYRSWDPVVGRRPSLYFDALSSWQTALSCVRVRIRPVGKTIPVNTTLVVYQPCPNPRISGNDISTWILRISSTECHSMRHSSVCDTKLRGDGVHMDSSEKVSYRVSLIGRAANPKRPWSLAWISRVGYFSVK